jgi:phosphonate ABC transporter permease subunit PhnE
MRIPAFVPLVESERTRRSWIGFGLEMVLWGYALLVAVRVLWFKIGMGFVEDLAYADKPTAWALNFVNRLEFDSRNFSLEWTSVFSIFGVGALLGAAVGATGRGFGSWIASLSRLQVNSPEDSLRIRRHWSYARKEGWGLLLLTLVAAWIFTKIDLGKLFDSEGVAGAGRLVVQLGCGLPGFGQAVSVGGSGFSAFGALQSLINGIFGLLNSIGAGIPLLAEQCEPTALSYYGMAVEKLAESIYLAFMATFLSVPIAFLFSFFAARNLTRHSRWMRFCYMAIRMYINVTRSIEPLIWAILFSVWIGIGPFAGSLALMVHSVSSLVKQYSESVEGIDNGPLEALQATGASRIAVVWFAVVPQIVMPYLAFTIYRWDINVRMATVIGLVGGGGIGGLLIQEQGLAHWPAVGSIAFLIFIVVWGMDFLSAKIREAIQ